MSPPKVWFISGCSSGFGLEIAKAALSRGDQVAATSRNASSLSELASLGALTLSMDLTASIADLSTITKKVIDKFGRIDILFNNAGYILEGGIEECTPEEYLAQFETNVFGTVRLIQAVLPYMRAQRSGVIAGMGSIGGFASTPGCGVYCSTKFTLSGLFEALAGEVKHLGLEAVLIEPGYFRTNFLTSGRRTITNNRIDDYKPITDALGKTFDATNQNQPGDPVKGSRLIVEAMTKSGRCEGKALPTRLILGTDVLAKAYHVTEERKAELDEWASLQADTQCDD